MLARMPAPCSSSGPRSAREPDDVPRWASGVDNPYLHGIYAPTRYETTAVDLEVEGELPGDLYGAFVRNGPNSVFEPSGLHHWFDGDGMVHGVYFRDGKADYRSRLVRTAGLRDEIAAGRALWPGVMGPYDFSAPRHFLKDTANTDLVLHAGGLLALWYLCGTPYRLDPLTLDTQGPEDFGGRLATPVSAHAKVDERTGELAWFTLQDFEPPYMIYGVVAKDGTLAHQVPIDLPGPRAPHDVTLTERYTILHDLPLFHDVEGMRRHGHRVARFHRDLPSRFGVLPRHGDTHDVRWFEFEPGYVLHMVNAWEEPGDWIVMDGCFQPDPTIRRRPEDGSLASMLGYLRIRAHLHRWRMNLATGETREEPLDDLNVEFCLPDTHLYGVRTRYSYHQHLPPEATTVTFQALVKYDHENASRTRFDYGPGRTGGEAPFARRRAAPGGSGRRPRDEDDGYVVSLVTDAASLRSECWVFSAREIERGPLAKVRLPTRVPTGFHAKWLPGERIWGD